MLRPGTAHGNLRGAGRTRRRRSGTGSGGTAARIVGTMVHRLRPLLLLLLFQPHATTTKLHLLAVQFTVVIALLLPHHDRGQRQQIRLRQRRWCHIQHFAIAPSVQAHRGAPTILALSDANAAELSTQVFVVEQYCQWGGGDRQWSSGHGVRRCWGGNGKSWRRRSRNGGRNERRQSNRMGNDRILHSHCGIRTGTVPAISFVSTTILSFGTDSVRKFEFTSVV
mmetsp:Transcript_35050/g.73966  ORF Transcript_35050/g.73966 Transcript_35050/m.73966 type:complete len:224 (+) Transcript_35050:1400-2071(+)